MAHNTLAQQTGSSQNYVTYDAQDNSFKGFYLAKEIAEQVGEYIEVTLDGEEGLELQYETSTTATHKYSTPDEVVRSFYVEPDTIQVPVDEQPPETLLVHVSEASEEEFEEEEEARLDEAADALLG